MMTDTWQAALLSAGIRLDEGRHRIEDFGDPAGECRAAVDGTIISDLAQLGVIAVRGDDAEKFLQGQFTNDVRQVTEQRAQLSAWCSAKGRVQVSFYLLKRRGAYYLLLPAASLDAVLKRLRFYVLRSAVQVEEVSEQFMRMGLAGADSAALLAEQLGLAVPDAPWACATLDNLSVLRLPGIKPRYLLFSDAQAAMLELWAGLVATARPVGVPAWELLDILAALPLVDIALAEAFVPQMLNLHHLGGLSFQKGCYTGQEVVARSQYLGTLKRSLYLALADATPCPAPGTRLYAPDESEPAGLLLNARPHPDGGCALLAVLKIAKAQAGEVRLGTADGPPLRFLPLPYPTQAD